VDALHPIRPRLTFMPEEYKKVAWADQKLRSVRGYFLACEKVRARVFKLHFLSSINDV
jgi:hypothetical protein